MIMRRAHKHCTLTSLLLFCFYVFYVLTYSSLFSKLARRIETPSEREIPRAAAEGSGLFERSSVSADFTPDLQGK